MEKYWVAIPPRTFFVCQGGDYNHQDRSMGLLARNKDISTILLYDPWILGVPFWYHALCGELYRVVGLQGGDRWEVNMHLKLQSQPFFPPRSLSIDLRFEQNPMADYLPYYNGKYRNQIDFEGMTMRTQIFAKCLITQF